MRKEVQELVNMGPLPDCETVTEEQLKTYESLLSRVTPPVSNDEARGLLHLFGPDDCYGLAWTLLHLIESARDGRCTIASKTQVTNGLHACACGQNAAATSELWPRASGMYSKPHTNSVLSCG